MGPKTASSAPEMDPDLTQVRGLTEVIARNTGSFARITSIRFLNSLAFRFMLLFLLLYRVPFFLDRQTANRPAPLQRALAS